MKTAEQNFQLLQEIEAGRDFLLMACEQNLELMERAEPRIRELFEYERGESVAQASGAASLSSRKRSHDE